MGTYCLKALEMVSAQLDRDVAFHKAGLSRADSLVLACYVEVACVDEEDAAVKLSAWEVAKRGGLNVATVKRALIKLFEKGLITRRQDVRQAGVVAWTQVSRAAFALFGLTGGVVFADGMPGEVKAALASESVASCAAISAAWSACDGFPIPIEQAWRGGSFRLELVRAALASRSLGAVELALEAAVAREHAALESAEGIVRIPCPGGEEVVVDVRQFDAHVQCPTDVAFARDVMLDLAVRQPGLVTPTSVPKLLAEVLYSRAVGFLAGADYTRSVRVLVSCIGGKEKPWGRPRGMWDNWYSAARAACRLSTTGSVSLH